MIRNGDELWKLQNATI